MMSIKCTFPVAAILGLLLSSSAIAGGLKMIQHEDAIEAQSVEFFVNAGGNGSVVVRECNTCAPVRLKVTRDTKAYDNGSEVPLASLSGAARQSAVVFYLVKDKTVSRITLQ